MDMKKTVLLRALLGFPLGIALGQLITLCISACYGGEYYPCVPTLVAQLGSELAAVALQTLLCGVLGAACAAASCAFQMEHWSISKATAVHFLVLSLSMLPIAYFSHWMEHTFAGVLAYFGVFLAIYAMIWLLLYRSVHTKVQKINKALKKG